MEFELNEFLDTILGNLMSKEGIEKVKEYIKNDMKSNDINYDTTKVACQVFDSQKNYDPRVEISSEGYKDGEVIFIDYHMD